jgi:hypothetical protein
MRRACLLALALALIVAGCGGRKAPKAGSDVGSRAAAPRFALLGVHALYLGAPVEDCERAFPAPEDAQSFVPDIMPGLPYAAWRDDERESFAAAFKDGKTVVAAIHRLRIDSKSEADDVFGLYEDRFGKGQRTEEQGSVTVVYTRGNECLTLWTTEKEGSLTFNESIEDTSVVQPAQHAKPSK